VEGGNEAAIRRKEAVVMSDSRKSVDPEPGALYPKEKQCQGMISQ